MTHKTCYLMVRDIEGQEDEAALEWGVHFDLTEGETLPEDVEELSEAQYTIFMMMQTLKGTFADAEVKTTMGDKGSGLIMPN